MNYTIDSMKNLLKEIGVKNPKKIIKKLKLTNKKKSSKDLLPFLSEEEIEVLNKLLKKEGEPLLDYNNILVNIVED